MKKKLHFNSEFYQEVIAILSEIGGKARLIGGCVRDALLGLASNDIDITTDLTPDQVKQVMFMHNIKTIDIGKDYGTITVFNKQEKFEITTLRKDLITDGRYAIVEFTQDFELDAKRRDFTINAISYCPITEVVYDYFYGIRHLNELRVVFIGDAVARIRVDYLRILRFLRFSIRYASDLDQKGFNACLLLKDGLKNLSKERVKSELDKIFLTKNLVFFLPSIILILQELELFLTVDLTTFIQYMELVSSYSLDTINDLSLIYSFLFYKKDLDSRYLKNYLISQRFTKNLSNRIIYLINLINTSLVLEEKARIKYIWFEQNLEYKYILCCMIALGLVNKKSVNEFLDQEISLNLPKFSITGQSDILNKIKFTWIQNDFNIIYLDKDNIIKLLDGQKK